MKKRVFMIAMAVGILLSFTASVWAGNPEASKLDSVVAAYRKKYNVNVDSGSTIKIPVQAQIAVASSLKSGYTGGKVDKITFSVTPSPAEAFDVTLEKNTLTSEIVINDTDTFAFGTNLTGKAKGSGTITVTGKAYIGTTEIGTDSADIVFTTEKGEDVVDPTFMVDGPNDDATKVDPSQVIDTAGDPDSDKWDGKDPTFGAIGGNGKDKPKVATSKTVFYGNDYDTTDKALKSGVAASFDIEIQGPGPEINVYVSAKDAKKLWPLSCDKKLTKKDKDWETDIPLTKENIKAWNIPFRVTVASLDSTAPESQDKNTKHTLTIAYNGAQVAYKGFPITVSVANDKTTDSKGAQKPVTKTYKIDIKSNKEVPQWVTATGVVGEKLAKKNAQEIPVSLGSGGTLGGTIYTVSADGPYYITAKEDKMGMSADVIQPELNKFGEVVTPGYVKVHGKFDDGDKGTKGGTKEVKVAFTLDAVGSVKKTSFKPTVVGKVSPYFEAKNLMSGDNNGKETSYAGKPNVEEADGSYTYDGWYKVKTAEAGKVPSVKFAAKGSKTITYALVSGGENLAQYGLSFDAKKAQIIQLTNAEGRKIDTKATMNAEGEYDPVEITVMADNGTGSAATVKALVGITGAKAKPYLGKDANDKELKNLVIPQNAEDGEIFTIGSIIGKNVATTESDDVNVHFRLADAKKAKEGGKELEYGEDTYALENLGLQFIPSSEFEDEFDEYNGEYRNQGVIKVIGSELTATKGAKINVILSNLGNEQKGTVNIVIQDPKPVIEVDETRGVGSSDVILSTEKQEVYLYLSEGAPTNTAKINWKIADNPTNKSNLTLKLSNPKEGSVTDYSHATLEVTAKAGKITGTVTDSLTITAENADSKLKSEKFTITLHSGDAYALEHSTPKDTESAPRTKKGSGAPNVGASPESEIESETETDETDETEGSVVFGEIRTVEQLTAGQKAFLAEKGYTVVAVLPEVKATADGQYEFEVELDEDAPEGAKLIWLAFPKDAEENEDDKIADFYDESGEAIEEVPAGKVIVVAPWLRADVTYQPVIAVEE